MKFSICIPNYNYERYVGRTIRSALDQTGADFEVLVSDNASTDGSVAIVEAFRDPRIRLRVNACNVGFAANLDRAASLGAGDRMLLLSSDDLLRPGALSTYRTFFEAIGSAGENSVATATVEVIDADDRVTGQVALPRKNLWTENDRCSELDAVAGGPIYRLAGHELLRRCLRTMVNPFQFATTVYPRTLYNAVEGYGGGRLINPDKWFHWKLLARCDFAYFIDRPLAAYRWHSSNQAAVQSGLGALKWMIDEYVSTFELDRDLLKQLGLERADVERAFVEHDVGRYGLAELARGQRRQARRIYHFAKAVYPQHAARNWKVRVLAILLTLGPIGEAVARMAYRRRLAAGEENAAWAMEGRGP